MKTENKPTLQAREATGKATTGWSVELAQAYIDRLNMTRNQGFDPEEASRVYGGQKGAVK